jgi:hypothetical protein
VVKLGTRVVAFDQDLKTRWVYDSPWSEYTKCPAYIPAVGDIDGDGRDEVFGGFSLIDDDGTVLWEKFLGRNMDSVAIAEWDHGQIRAIGSGFGHVLDIKGNVVLAMGEDLVPHGQELRVGRFDPTVPGMQMMIRYNGHTEEVMLVNVEGEVIRRFLLNPSPNNTGMEVAFWDGPGAPPLLLNGGVLWNGFGEIVLELPDLPPSFGNPRQGWYHCIPVNLHGDDREEIIVYIPWDAVVHVFSQEDPRTAPAAPYAPGPRQYNPRLMD